MAYYRYLPGFIAIGVGTVMVAFSLPTHLINCPELVTGIGGGTTELPVTVTNLRGGPVSAKWKGDCCSAPQTLTVRGFDSRTMHVQLDLSRFGEGAMDKVLNLALIREGKTSQLVFPYRLVVK